MINKLRYQPAATSIIHQPGANYFHHVHASHIPQKLFYEDWVVGRLNAHIGSIPCFLLKIQELVQDAICLLYPINSLFLLKCPL